MTLAQDVLEGVAGQHERMKELVAAVVDAERGKGASLSALLAEQDKRAASRPLKEDHDRVRSEVCFASPPPSHPQACRHAHKFTLIISLYRAWNVTLHGSKCVFVHHC